MLFPSSSEADPAIRAPSSLYSHSFGRTLTLLGRGGGGGGGGRGWRRRRRRRRRPIRRKRICQIKTMHLLRCRTFRSNAEDMFCGVGGIRRSRQICQVGFKYWRSSSPHGGRKRRRRRKRRRGRKRFRTTPLLRRPFPPSPSSSSAV